MNKATANKLRRYFLSRKETIAVAESVTSGLLQLYFSELTDAVKFYHGGITVYNLGQKYKHLQVEPIHAQACNCVSMQIAEQMAINVCSSFGSHWGIGITGYATPVPESGNKLFCYYAIAEGNSIHAAGEITSKKIPPLKVKEFYRDTIINEFVKLLSK